MIYLRDDDVLVASRSYDCEFGRFKQLHEWIARCPAMMHRPGIVIEGGEGGGKGLQDYPEAVEYIRKETLEGRMQPELHGWFHIDYAALPLQNVREHLAEGCEWIERELGRRPTRWYTPWGADSEKLRAAAQEAGLTLVGIDKHWGIDRAVKRLSEGGDPTDLLEREIFFHWWGGGARVARLCAVVRHGSWAAAKKAEREIF